MKTFEDLKNEMIVLSEDEQGKLTGGFSEQITLKKDFVPLEEEKEVNILCNISINWRKCSKD